MKIINVVGARPNFMKIAPIRRAIHRHNQRDKKSPIQHILVHTGQHYDYDMSRVFFEDLDLPEPDIYLGVGSGTHAEQTGKVMIAFEKILLAEKPDLLIVVGDVNSTLACTLAAVKLLIPVAHVEAGLRSFDRTMPEEINRIVTDSLSTYLFTPSPDADENLRNEGIPSGKIFLVGDVMVDSLLFNRDKARKSPILKELGLTNTRQVRSGPAQGDKKNPPPNVTTEYALLTLHRPSNVDDREALFRIIEALAAVSQRIPIIFPIHPRTRKQIEQFGFEHYFNHVPPSATTPPPHKINLIDPLGYLGFLQLMLHAKLVMTDSGGIQEETTVLDIPCLTLRDTTERPITITQGTNTLVGNDTETIIAEADKILEGQGKRGSCPFLWDGKTAKRVIEVLVGEQSGRLNRKGGKR